MSTNEQKLREMLLKVARALPAELRDQMAFVGGGSITALLLTDDIVKEGVRFTEDIDLILNAKGHGQWFQVQQQLRQCGFRESAEDEVICRMRLGSLKVDFMPDDEAILGFSNRWYSDSLATANPYELTEGITIKLLEPVYFIATKLEAWRGRGGNDPMSSHDLEDILTLVDGRNMLGDEIAQAEENVRSYIAEQFRRLKTHPDFDYALTGNISDPARAGLVWNRWDRIAGIH